VERNIGMGLHVLTKARSRPTLASVTVLLLTMAKNDPDQVDRPS
jgi:hypothetical protein